MDNIEGVLATVREEVAALLAMRTAPPSTSLREATSPSEEGEG